MHLQALIFFLRKKKHVLVQSNSITQARKIGNETHLVAFDPELEEADPLGLEERGVGLRVGLRAQIPASPAGEPNQPIVSNPNNSNLTIRSRGEGGDLAAHTTDRRRSPRRKPKLAASGKPER